MPRTHPKIPWGVPAAAFPSKETLRMSKSTPLSITAILSHSATDASPWSEATASDIGRLPYGRQSFWGVPFDLADGTSPSLAVAGADGSSSTFSLPIGSNATYLVFAHFCDSRASTTVPVGDFGDPQTADYASPVVTAPGEHLADYVLIYEDGSEHRTPVRRRFEINQVSSRMQSAFAARPHQEGMPLDHRGPYPKNTWGRMQTIVNVGEFGPVEKVQGVDQGAAPSSWSIYALPNPHPDRQISALRIEPTGAAAIGGVG